MGMGSGLAAGPLRAGAQRIRILPGAAAIDDTSAAPGAASPVFRRFVASVRTGGARRHGPLWILWLRAAAPAPRLDVVTLEEARTRGDLVVTERAQATVPALIVENRGKAHALLMAGEILLGGKQHRVIIEDVLLPPRSGPRDLAVYCVEQGRWTERSEAFETRGSFAAPRLRSRVMERADQARVWAEVGRYAAKAAAAVAHEQLPGDLRQGRGEAASGGRGPRPRIDRSRRHVRRGGFRERGVRGSRSLPGRRALHAAMAEAPARLRARCLRPPRSAHRRGGGAEAPGGANAATRRGHGWRPPRQCRRGTGLRVSFRSLARCRAPRRRAGGARGSPLRSTPEKLPRPFSRVYSAGRPCGFSRAGRRGRSGSGITL